MINQQHGEPGVFIFDSRHEKASIVEGALLVTQRESMALPVNTEGDGHSRWSHYVKIPAGSSVLVLEKFGRPEEHSFGIDAKDWACVGLYNGMVLEIQRVAFHTRANPCNEIWVGTVGALSISSKKKTEKPKGTTMTALAKNSGGVEPIFSPFYQRRLFSAKRMK